MSTLHNHKLRLFLSSLVVAVLVLSFRSSVHAVSVQSLSGTSSSIISAAIQHEAASFKSYYNASVHVSFSNVLSTQGLDVLAVSTSATTLDQYDFGFHLSDMFVSAPNRYGVIVIIVYSDTNNCDCV